MEVQLHFIDLETDALKPNEKVGNKKVLLGPVLQKCTSKRNLTVILSN